MSSWKERNPNYWREWSKRNPDYAKNYRSKNRDKIRAYNKKYREENYDKYIKYQIDFYVKKQENLIKEKEEKDKTIDFNKSVINLSSNTPADGLLKPDELTNNLHTIYDASLHKFIIPVNKLNI